MDAVRRLRQVYWEWSYFDGIVFSRGFVSRCSFERFCYEQVFDLRWSLMMLSLLSRRVLYDIWVCFERFASFALVKTKAIMILVRGMLLVSDPPQGKLITLIFSFFCR